MGAKRYRKRPDDITGVQIDGPEEDIREALEDAPVEVMEVFPREEPWVVVRDRDGQVHSIPKGYVFFWGKFGEVAYAPEDAFNAMYKEIGG